MNSKYLSSTRLMKTIMIEFMNDMLIMMNHTDKNLDIDI